MKTLALLSAAAALLLIAPGDVAGAPDAATKKRCHVVIKKVHGTKKRVRVCTKPRPRPKPSAVRRVDVGGYKLALECRGKGSPAVVLDSGFGTGRGAWSRVLPKVSSTTRICSYDRAGLGQSDRRPRRLPPTTARVVTELHALLERAGVAPPYVLGGWSIGGIDVRYYGKQYPAEVAGLVLVDGTPPAFLPTARISSPFETMIVGDSAAALDPPPPLGSLPLIDLTHGIPYEDAVVEARWVDEQKRVTSSSTNSMLVRADAVGHDIPEGSPLLVATALKLVVGRVRAAGALPPCPQTSFAQMGGTCLDPNAR